MENIKLIQNLEKVSLNIPDRILKIKGHVINKNKKEDLEIIIYKGFSSSTTHPIDPNHEKDVIDQDYILLSCQLFRAPLSENYNPILKDIDKIELFLNMEYWY